MNSLNDLGHIIEINLNSLTDLTERLWNGEISEKLFLEEGMALYIEPARLQAILDDLREIDGVLVKEEPL